MEGKERNSILEPNRKGKFFWLHNVISCCAKYFVANSYSLINNRRISSFLEMALVKQKLVNVHFAIDF